MTTNSMTNLDEDRQQHPETIILGVDTHKDIHAAAILSSTGALLANATFATTTTGYRNLLTWAKSFGELHRAGVEGTGSYGAGLTRYLRSGGLAVCEVNRPDRTSRRRKGKTDAFDAEAAARSVISGEATTIPKSADGPVEIPPRLPPNIKRDPAMAVSYTTSADVTRLANRHPALRLKVSLPVAGQVAGPPPSAWTVPASSSRRGPLSLAAGTNLNPEG
ncbi:transposase [Micromonospora sp. M71_S20]|uniref:IS110 family transposase n=1 Tax=Micromonospora sp. M71_S20 TaxID=592872 RepID=UPI0011E593B0|nr:transposase [Micromonospora sp. M71_S20]